jgi:polyisoprenoid-binding protein YceI
VSKFIFLILFSLNLISAKADYRLDKARSSIGFIAKTSLFGVDGEFEKFDIQVLNPNNIILKIEANSLNTNNKKRDAHLKNQDFFNTTKYPEIIFKSNKISKIKEASVKNNLNYLVSGVLKIKNKSHEITFPAEIYRIKGKFEVSANLEISRKKFGIDYETSFPMPSIKDKVQVNFEIYLNHMPK